MISLAGNPKQAVIFDLDGTLYDQKPVRRAMLLRLLRAHLTRPLQGIRTLRLLQSYRNAQETMRLEVPNGQPRDLAQEQARVAAQKAGVSLEEARVCVERWMQQEPLDLLLQHRRPGVVELLQTARDNGLRLGLLSDYPAHSKLRHMQIDRFFEVVVSAQDAEVGVFKPDPRGLEVALRRLNVAPSAALYVGDRPEVDFAAAQAAGVDCVILTRKPEGVACPTAASCDQLLSLLFAHNGNTSSTIPEHAQPAPGGFSENS